jgi:CTP:molybdopterin cytidylyltransferase MocA
MNAGARVQALVLAGDRTARDPVAVHAGVPCKAAAPVGGVALLARVLTALRRSPDIGRIVVVGPEDGALASCPGLASALAQSGAVRLAPQDSPSRSAAAGLAVVDPDAPVLLTTADHALLTPAIVSAFIAASRASGAHLTVGLVPWPRVQAAFPGVRRTVLRFRDGEFCTCNLFGMRVPAGRSVIDFWAQVERQRKHPARLVAGVLGPTGFIGYLFGVLTLRGALRRASRRFGARIEAVFLDDPEASVDVDTPDDLRRVEDILARRAGH